MYPNSRIEKAHFLVYSNEAAPFGENSDYYCDSALRAGFDTATHYTEAMLRKTPFWDQNRDILEQGRGAGYWLWKPYIILEKLRQVGPNDIVIYNDAGRYSPRSFEPFPAFPHEAAELTAMTPKRFILGTRIEWLVQGQYTKRDCMILAGGDTDEMRYAPQINACPALFMPSEESFAFLERWLEIARDPRALTDMPTNWAHRIPNSRITVTTWPSPRSCCISARGIISTCRMRVAWPRPTCCAGATGMCRACRPTSDTCP